MTTAHGIADSIEAFKSFYASTSIWLRFLNEPYLLDILNSWGIDPGSTSHLGRQDGSSYGPIEIYPALLATRNNPQYNLEFLAVLLAVGIISVGDAITREHLSDQSPELEFLRHIRNAAAHGNAFNLRQGEPARPAAFKGFAISPALNGTPLLFAYIAAGDVFDLFDYLRDWLRAP